MIVNKNTLYAIKSINYAYGYFRTYKVSSIVDPYSRLSYPTKLNLLSHSIELALKSYLSLQGYTKKQLRDFGHDLNVLLQEFESQKFIRFDPYILETLSEINKYYKNKYFDYYEGQIKFKFKLKFLEFCARGIICCIEGTVNPKGRFHNTYCTLDGKIPQSYSHAWIYKSSFTK